jgi:hypothetical protein
VTADLLRRQLRDAAPDEHAMLLMIHGARLALLRASVVGIEAAYRELLDAELSDDDTIRACRSALQQAADRILATAKRPDPADEVTRMSVGER